MCSLQDLPPEILHSILDELVVGSHDSELETWACTTQDSPALAALAQTNRNFNTIVTPVLYRQIAIPYTDWDEDNKERLMVLIRTLLQNSSRLAMITELRLQGHKFGGAAYSNLVTPDFWSQTMIGKAYKFVHCVMDSAFGKNEDKHEEWLEECRKGCVDFLVPLLVARLPAVRVLDIQKNDDAFWTRLDEIVSALTQSAQQQNTKAPLHTVRLVRAGNDDSQGYPDKTRPLAIIAKWPSVRTIIAGQTGDGDSQLDPPTLKEFTDLEPRSTNLEVVRFTHQAKLLGEHLFTFLGVAKALREFYFHIDGGW